MKHLSLTARSIPAGKTVIADGAVAKVAWVSARKVPGVFALGADSGRALGTVRDALAATDLGPGIRVAVGQSQVAVDVELVAEYDVPLQDLADRVRDAVYRAVQSIVGMQVVEVNVDVVQVHLP